MKKSIAAVLATAVVAVPIASATTASAATSGQVGRLAGVAGYHLAANTTMDDTDMLILCSSYLTSGHDEQVSIMNKLVRKLAVRDKATKKFTYTPADIEAASTFILEAQCSDYAMAGYAYGS